MAIDKAKIEALRDGIDSALDRVETALLAEVYAEKLPIIGDHLKSIFSGQQSLQQVQILESVIINALNAVIAAGDFSQAKIQATLNSYLSSNNFQTSDLVSATIAGDNLTLSFDTHKVANAFSLNVDSHFGLPGIDFQTGGTVNASLTYDLDFSVGVDSAGFYFGTGGVNPEFKLDLAVSGANLNASSNLGFMTFRATDLGSSLNGSFAIDITDNGDGYLRVDELANVGLDLLNAKFTGGADIKVHLDADMADSGVTAVLPDISADLGVTWNFSASAVNPLDSNSGFGQAPTVTISNVEYDFGSFVKNFVEPVLEVVVPVLRPINAAIDIFRADLDFLKVIPGFAGYVDKAGGRTVDGKDKGDGHITLVDFMKLYSPSTNFVETIDFINLVDDIIDWTTFFGDNVFSTGVDFELGDFTLSGDIRNAAFEIANATQNIATTTSNLASFLSTLSGSGYSKTDPNSKMTGQEILQDMFLGDDTSFSFPLLSNPQQAVRLLLGGNADLFSLDLPQVNVPIGSPISLVPAIPIPFFPVLSVELQGAVGLMLDLGFGYDTSGLVDYKNSGNLNDVFNGFYLSDWNKNGVDVDEVRIEAALTLALSLTGGGIGGGGGIAGSVHLNLNDQIGGGFVDGKLYWNEIAATLGSNPFELFDAGGSIEAFFTVFVRVLGYDVWRYNSPRITLGEFNFSDDPGVTAPPTGLGSVNGKNLELNFGSKAGEREISNKTDGDEAFQVSNDKFGGGYQVKAYGSAYKLTSVDTITGDAGEGKDQVEIKADVTLAATIYGGVGDDAIYGGLGNDHFYGGADRDYLYGRGGDDILEGDDGDDVLEGGAGADQHIGGAGIDVATYENSTAIVTINLTTGVHTGDALGDTFNGIEVYEGTRVEAEGDIIVGSANGESIFGLNGDDRLEGMGGKDLLGGNEGNDYLDGGAGDDTLAGGFGDDIYVVDSAGDIVDEDGVNPDQAGGKDKVISSIDFSLSTLEDIEDLELTGNAISGTGNKYANLIKGNAKDNLLDGGDGEDTIYGGAGTDGISGGDGVDHLFGEAGNDILDGGAKADDLDGGADDDVLYGGADADTLKGNIGNDTLDGGTGIDTLEGNTGDDIYIVDDAMDIIVEVTGEGKDTVRASVDFALAADDNIEILETADADGASNLKLTGNALAQKLNGNKGDNVLAGLGGADQLDGGAGFDVASYLASAAAIQIDLGAAKFKGGDAEGDTIANIEAIWGSDIGAGDTLTGSVGDDIALFGKAGDDTLTGLGGTDKLYGGNDKDTLDGGSGDDIMDGGAGDDLYYVDSLNDIVHEGVGGDGSGGIDKIVANLDYSLSAKAERYDIENLDLVGAARKGTGNGQSNKITGTDFDDTLDGASGSDLLIGGKGSDTYYFDDLGDQVVENANQGVEQIYFTTQSLNDKAVNATTLETWGVNVENLEVTDSLARLDIRGNALDNILKGNALDTKIEGLDGNDTLIGGGGIDTLYGGEGNDRGVFDLIGRSDNDKFYGGNGIDTLVMNWATASQNITSSDGSYFQVFNPAYGTNDSLSYFDVERFDLTGGAGRDDLLGGALDDILVGNAGNDRLRGLNGKGTYDGGDGTDFVVAKIDSTVADSFVLNLKNTQSAFVTVNAGKAMETKWKGVEVVQLQTGSGNDTLDVRGIEANGRDWTYNGNTFDAGAGNDTFAIDYGSIGDHVFAAGDGTDTLIIDWSKATENITTVDGNYFRVFHNSIGNNDNVSFSGVERFELTGGAGRDDLLGGALDDILVGNAGNDRLRGLNGKGTYDGGDGTDFVVAKIDSTVADSFVLNLKNTQSAFVTVNAGKAMETKWKGVEVVQLQTGSGNDTLDVRGIVADGRDWGFNGNTFDAGAGNDTFAIDYGSIGDHVFAAGDGTDTLIIDWSKATENITTVDGNYFRVFHNSIGNNDNVSFSGVERFELTGGSGRDDLLGGALDDILVGNAGNDRLRGLVGKGSYDGGSDTDFVVAKIDSTAADSFVLNLKNTQSAFVTVNAGKAMETKWKGVEVVQLQTGAGNDTLDVRGIEANGRDWTYNGNTFDAGAGNDTFAIDYGSIGDHVFAAGDGTDTLIIDWSKATENITTVDGNYFRVFHNSIGNNDNVSFSGVERFELTGGSGRDDLLGGALDDILVGNAGNDRLRGLNGKGTYDGGDGTDFVVAKIDSTVADSFVLNLKNTQSAFVTVNAGKAMETKWKGVEVVQLQTGSGNDTLDVRGIVADGRDWGFNGNTFDAGAGNDTFAIDYGSIGDHVFAAGDGTDTLIIDWSKATENITTVDGNYFRVFHNSIGNNDNVSFSGVERFELTGGSGRDDLLGGALDDILVGNAGNDRLRGLVGKGSYDGGSDTDFVVAKIDSTAADSFVLNLKNTQSAFVTVNAGKAMETKWKGVEVVQLQTGAGNDTLDVRGIEANGRDWTYNGNTFDAGAGNDTFAIDYGSIGDHVFAAGDGTDTLIIDWSKATENITTVDGNYFRVFHNSIGNNDNVSFSGVERFELTGGSGRDDLLGGALDDILIGNGGVDTLRGGGGKDTLNGGADADQMIGGAGDDTYVVDDSSDIVVEDGNGGNDLVQSSATFTLSDNVENLTLTGSGHANGTGNNLVNILLGNSGNNRLDGKAGADTMIGGLGDDTYVMDVATDKIVESTKINEGNDTVEAGFTYTLATFVENLTLTGNAKIDGTGNAVANTLIGNTANNILKGFDGNDTLEGRAGNDMLDGGTGADKMYGGLGDDTYIVDNIGDIVSDLDSNNEEGGIDTVQTSFTLSLDGFIENLVLTGTAAANGTGNALANVITGNGGTNIIAGLGGADTLDGGAGIDTLDYSASVVGVTVTLNGATQTIASGGDADGDKIKNFENIIGSSVADNLTGDGLVNTLDGRGGIDTLKGLGGNDIYIVDDTGDIVIEDKTGGTDLVQSSATFVLSANVENLTLTGSADIDGTGNDLANILLGNAGKNRLNGGLGADTMTGGLGDDIYVVDAAGDKVVESGKTNEGVDTVEASVTYTLGVFVENLTLTGTAKDGTGNILANTIIGNSSANTLKGLDGNDTLEGRAGNDTLDGGTGADKMYGGLGDDIYIVDNLADEATDLDSNNEQGGVDTVQSSVTFTLSSDIENLTLTGASATNGTGNALANTITGNAGANIIAGLGGTDTIDGGAGTDTLDYSASEAVKVTLNGATQTTATGGDAEGDKIKNFENIIGSAFADELTGDSLANTLDGRGGIDKLKGLGGNDIYIVDDSADIIIEDKTGGTDLVQSSATFTLSAFVENLTLTGSNNINGTGNDLANILLGNFGNNRLDGGLGADTMTGGLGDDIYVVDVATDKAIEKTTVNEGIDTVESAATWTLTAFFENLTLTGAAKIDGTGNNLANIITGNSDHNILKGMDGIDTLEGRGGNDTLDGGAGADKMYGGLGDDTYIVDNLGDVVSDLDSNNEQGGVDTVQSSVTFTLGDGLENLTLTGTTAINGTGNAAANIIVGNGGANVIAGLGGADTLDGGAGIDTLDYSASDNGVTIELKGAIATTGIGGHAAGDSIKNFESIFGSGLGDVLKGDGVANTLTGGGGADKLTGGAGSDIFAFLNAGDGGDQIFDFATGDKIQISKSGFGIAATVTAAGTGLNNFASEYFTSGTSGLATKSGHGQFIVDTDYSVSQKALLWDADGTGNASNAELIATFDNNYLLKATDFLLVS